MSDSESSLKAIRKKSSLQRRIIAILLVLLVMGCGHVGRRTLAPEITQGLINFLRDGTTERKEVLNRLGEPTDIYENGRILIYQPLNNIVIPINYEYKDGVLVLVFTNDEILERHSIVVFK